MVLWTGLIFVLGTDTFSASGTRGWLRTLIVFFIPDLSEAELDPLVFLARKGMHLALYFGLGAMAFRAFRLQLVAATGTRVLILAIALAAAVAVADETRQAFLANRTGAPEDVAIDTAGAGGGALLLAAWTNRKSGEVP